MVLKVHIQVTSMTTADVCISFLTGTQYPNEKLLSAFAVYTYPKSTQEIFKQAAKDLYHQGFGARMKKKKTTAPKITVDREKNTNIRISDRYFSR